MTEITQAWSSTWRKSERVAKKQKTGDGKRNGHLSKRAIMAIAKQVQSLNLNMEEGSVSEQSEASEAPTVKISNRVKSSLKRKKN